MAFVTLITFPVAEQKSIEKPTLEFSLNFFIKIKNKLLNTLALSGTQKEPKMAKTTIVSGNGSDITNAEFLSRKSKGKLVTSTVILSLIDQAKEHAYWNTYHCQSKLVSNNGKLYGNYCKNRFCSTCCAWSLHRGV